MVGTQYLHDENNTHKTNDQLTSFFPFSQTDILHMTEAERQQRLDIQKSDKWHQFVDGEVILKQGFVNKRKGLFARKRMLLLTTGPRLVYVDPVQMVKKGEIAWTSDLRVEPRNFKIFYVHTVRVLLVVKLNDTNKSNYLHSQALQHSVYFTIRDCDLGIDTARFSRNRLLKPIHNNFSAHDCN